MNLILRLFTSVALFIVFNSCDNENENPAPVCQLTNIKYFLSDPTRPTSPQVFVYHGTKLVSDGPDSLLYDNDGNLTGLLRKYYQIHKFTYDGEDIVKQEWFTESSGRLDGRVTYEYENHRLVKLQEYINVPGDTWWKGDYETFEYSDDSYNVSKITRIHSLQGVDGGIASQEEYTYLPQKSQFSTATPAVLKWYRLLGLPTDRALLGIKHMGNDLTTFEYTWNENGLPSACWEYFNGDNSGRQEYTYSCN